MSDRLLRILIALYPRRWRRRYGVELEQLIAQLDSEHSRTRARLVAGLIGTAAIERIRAPGMRIVATILVIVAVGTTIAVLATQSSGPSSRAAALIRAGRELEAHVDIFRLQAKSLCSTVKPGTRAHAIELDPKDGAIIARVVLACSTARTYG